MIVYGKQVVLYILQKHPKKIKEVFLTKEIDSKLFRKFTNLGVKIIRPDNKKAQALARGGNHQGFLLDIEDFTFSDISSLKKSDFLVILDRLSDVGNIGAIVRTSYALGASGVIISGIKHLDPSSIIRTSSGAMLDMPIGIYNSSYDLANELKQVGFTLVGASMNSEDIKEFQAPDKTALFLGSEGEGLSNKLEKKLDKKVSIKMYNGFDSLNVSVAAGILIHSLKK